MFHLALILPALATVCLGAALPQTIVTGTKPITSRQTAWTFTVPCYTSTKGCKPTTITLHGRDAEASLVARKPQISIVTISRSADIPSPPPIVTPKPPAITPKPPVTTKKPPVTTKKSTKRQTIEAVSRDDGDLPPTGTSGPVLGSPSRTVYQSPTAVSTQRWPTHRPHPHPSKSSKSSKSSKTTTTQEPTTWITYTYPAPVTTRTSPPVLTVPLDRREPQEVGWPTRTLLQSLTPDHQFPTKPPHSSRSSSASPTAITDPPYTPPVSPSASTATPPDAGTTTCMTDPWASPSRSTSYGGAEPSRSTSYGGADTTRTIPVITVPIDRRYTRSVVWGGPGTTRSVPIMTVPLARDIEAVTRSVVWSGPYSTRTASVLTVPVDKRQVTPILGSPSRTVLQSPTPDLPAPPTSKPTVIPPYSPTSKPSPTTPTKPTGKPTGYPIPLPTYPGYPPHEVEAEKRQELPGGITRTGGWTVYPTRNPQITRENDAVVERDVPMIEERQTLGDPTRTDYPWPTEFPPIEVPTRDAAAVQERQVLGDPTRTSWPWFTYVPRPTPAPAVVEERQILGDPTRTSWPWYTYIPRPTPGPVRKRLTGDERRRQEIGGPVRTVIMGA